MSDARMPYRVSPVSLAAIHVDGDQDTRSQNTSSTPPPTTPQETTTNTHHETTPTSTSPIPVPNALKKEVDVPLEYVPDKSVLMPDKTTKPVHTLRASRTTPPAWDVPPPQEPEHLSTPKAPGVVSWSATLENIAVAQRPTTPEETSSYDVSLLHRVLSGMGTVPPEQKNENGKRVGAAIDPPDMWEAATPETAAPTPTTPIPTTVRPSTTPEATPITTPTDPTQRTSGDHLISSPPHESTGRDGVGTYPKPGAAHPGMPTTGTGTVPSAIGNVAVPMTTSTPSAQAATPVTTISSARTPANGGNLELLRTRVLQESVRHGTSPLSEQPPLRISQFAHADLREFEATAPIQHTTPTTAPQHAAPAIPVGTAEEQQTPKPHTMPTTPLSSVHTFKRDVEDTITKNRISVVDVIAAEEKMRSADVLSNVGQPTQKRTHLSPGMYALVGASITLLLGAAGLLSWYIIDRNGAERSVRGNTYFMTEHTITYNIAKRSRSAIMRGLVGIRGSLAVGIGSITDVRVVKNDTDAREDAEGQRVTGPEFLSSISAGTSDRLIRALGTNMLLGIHESAANQPFLLLDVTYYENAFAGMLAWETSMERDLAPLFSNQTITNATTTPVSNNMQRLESPNVHANPASTTSSSTLPTATIPVRTEPTPSTPSTPSTLTIAGVFGDALLDNAPARVLRDRYGRIRFVWTMPNPTTILITTNEYTVAEVKRRLTARQF